MLCLVDTNILIRLANVDDPQYQVVSDAIESLHQNGDVTRITSQVLIEFRAVATRPVSANGLGLTAVETDAKAAKFEAMFMLLEETPAIFPLWKSLVTAAGSIGKQVHDARLVAVCHSHGMTHLLTLNGKHFARLARFGPGLVIIDPVVV